jgi:hypothetical protein
MLIINMKKEECFRILGLVKKKKMKFSLVIRKQI